MTDLVRRGKGACDNFMGRIRVPASLTFRLGDGTHSISSPVLRTKQSSSRETSTDLGFEDGRGRNDPCGCLVVPVLPQTGRTSVDESESVTTDILAHGCLRGFGPSFGG